MTLFILTLLLGSILFPLSVQVDQRRVAQTEQQLAQIKEALIGFAITRRYLPCPAVSSSNGLEDRTATGCTGGKRVGFLPWVTLGLDPADAWDNLFRYSVAVAYTSSNPSTLFTLDDTGDITIQTRDSAGALVSLSNADIPTAVVSLGKNGFGATARDGSARIAPAGADEQTNATNPGTTFVWRVHTDRTTAPGGEFDDVVVWITPNILNSRMVAAGRLP